jgi:NTE family protein
MAGVDAPDLISSAREWIRRSRLKPERPVRIGLALGGGFARGIAHAGVLRALERRGIPIHAIAGVSAGSIVAALYAGGLTPDEIEIAARGMRFRDVARWTISKFGLAGSDRMGDFLARLLKNTLFENMRMPLAVVASDLVSGKPVVFRDRGDVVLPVRASCAYPGLFTPIRYNGYCLVDGMVSLEVPARPLLEMGCTHVISVALPDSTDCLDPRNMFSVISRSFQVLNTRTQGDWRKWSNIVVSPEVSNSSWDSFEHCADLIAAGERAMTGAIPQMKGWLSRVPLESPMAAAS